MDLATEGKLAYLVADVSIVYGTNIPITQVIIKKCFSDVFSVQTLFQLLGRAGRVGKSWKARAIIHKSFGDAIKAYTINQLPDIETENCLVKLKELSQYETLETKLERLKRELALFDDSDDEFYDFVETKQPSEKLPENNFSKKPCFLSTYGVY